VRLTFWYGERRGSCHGIIDTRATDRSKVVIRRLGEDYLLKQSYFSPYPGELPHFR